MSKAAIIRAISLDIEHETGADSVDTIERFQLCDYDVRNSCDEPCGKYHCAFPGCSFKTQYSYVMWLHEHMQDCHEPLLGWTLTQFLEEL